MVGSWSLCGESPQHTMNLKTILSLRDLLSPKLAAVLSISALLLSSVSADASIAYGSINNFDTVNDTGSETHGFEIEIEDCRSTDVTYTYNYNHYGVPQITEDNSVLAHPKTIIRWESKKNANGSWAAYTAIPSGPILPTDGHRFTNPAINFGGEHFGVGNRAAVGAVRYNWLIDNGAGALVHGGAVQVSTPSFTYYPAVVGNPAPARVQAVIAPPPPPVPEPLEFGKAVWVKEIRTTTHNNNEVKLRNLISDDPDDANDKNWRNGEPDEVETEWQILQKDYNEVDGGANNQIPAAAEDLPGGNEVVTRRYEFFKYAGPHDTGSGEAMAQSVGPDGIHGLGTKIINGVNVDLSTVVVVGAFTGSQMAAVDVDAAVGLIDHVSEGQVNTAYAARTVVVEGALPFTATREGALPSGMAFNEVTGVLSGMPTASGQFNFKVTVSDGLNADVSKNYTLLIAAAGGQLPPGRLLDTTVLPVGTGTTTGDGSFAPGSNVTVTATAVAGFRFANWTDNGKVVSTSASYTIAIDVNHSLVANFTVDVPQWSITTSTLPGVGGTTSGGGMKDDGSSVTIIATANAGYAFTKWTEGAVQVSTSASYTFTATANRTLVANFTAVPTYIVTTSAAPAAGGTTTGGGSYFSGTSATVSATANAGYVFSKWTVGGTQVSNSPSYAFTVTANKTLVANFVILGTQQTITTSASPVAGGTTSGGGIYAAGESATVVATANPGYAFASWQEGSTTVSTTLSYTFTVTGSRTLVAKFTEAFVITTSSSPGIGGTTEMDSLTYKTGDNARARAFPAAGYTFANWTENNAVVSTNTSYTFNVTGNRTLVAYFLSDTGVTITTSSAPAAGGTTAGEGGYFAGDNVTVSATPNASYAFVNWTVGGAVVSVNPDYTFTAATNRALVANFVVPPTIAASAAPPTGGTVSGGGDYMNGDLATLTATPNPGYAFIGWTESGTIVSPAVDYTFTVTGARTLVANFIALPPLAIAPGAPGANVMVLSWPAAAAGWVLEETADLVTWTPSVRVITTSAGQKTVTIATTGGSRFFRLAYP